eukprot:augustus_masked-scaffold_33-processed-gene-2.13-mRNA-1 protein AED:0.92 eAED:1.00 QI:0/-1/0/1/-1/1/1/0/639
MDLMKRGVFGGDTEVSLEAELARRTHHLNDLSFIPKRLRAAKGFRTQKEFRMGSRKPQEKEDKEEGFLKKRKVYDSHEYSKFDKETVKNLKEAREQIQVFFGKDNSAFSDILKEIRKGDVRAQRIKARGYVHPGRSMVNRNEISNQDKLVRTENLMKSKYALSVFDPILVKPRDIELKTKGNNRIKKKTNAGLFNVTKKMHRLMKTPKGKTKKVTVSLSEKLNQIQQENQELIKAIQNEKQGNKASKLQNMGKTRPRGSSPGNNFRKPRFSVERSVRQMDFNRSKKNIKFDQSKSPEKKCSLKQTNSYTLRRSIDSVVEKRKQTAKKLPAYVFYKPSRAPRTNLSTVSKQMSPSPPETPKTGRLRTGLGSSRKLRKFKKQKMKLALALNSSHEDEKVSLNQRHEDFFLAKKKILFELKGRLFLNNFNRPLTMKAKLEGLKVVLRPKKKYRRQFIKILEIKENLEDLQLLRHISKFNLAQKFTKTLEVDALSWFRDMLKRFIFTESFLKCKDQTLNLLHSEKLFIFGLQYYLIQQRGQVCKLALKTLFKIASADIEKQSKLLQDMTNFIAFEILGFSVEEYMDMLRKNKIELPDPSTIGRKKIATTSMVIGGGLRALTYGLKWKRIYEERKKQRGGDKIR